MVLSYMDIVQNPPSIFSLRAKTEISITILLIFLYYYIYELLDLTQYNEYLLFFMSKNYDSLK